MKIHFLLGLLLVGSCSTLRYSEKVNALKKSIVFNNKEVVSKYAKTITAEELKSHLYDFVDPSFEGRKTGEDGHNRACEYLKEFYKSHSIASPKGIDYFQKVKVSDYSQGYADSQNVIAFIEGEKYPNEVLIICGHSDHEGIVDGEIYYGADDNGSGTSALLEIAEAFKLAEQEGYKPQRSIVFIHMTGEEIGLIGSQYYTENPIFPIENTVSVLNVDMVGRVDQRHIENENYIYLIGTERISTELHYVSEKANELFTQLELDYEYNGLDDINRYYYRSDHYSFARKGIPSIFYFNGEHEDYTKPTDTADKINYDLLAKRTKLVFATAWYIANSENRLSNTLLR